MMELMSTSITELATALYKEQGLFESGEINEFFNA